MKSTGLFGKNSGRVGGIVYSNYRGEQIVRTYQPKVKNPSTARQVIQRARFKLASQLAVSFAKEINMSFVPQKSNQSPRNAWISETLKSIVYSQNEASLPIEEVVLTKSRSQTLNVTAQGGFIRGSLLNTGFITAGEVANPIYARVVIVGYNEGGEIVILSVSEPPINQETGQFQLEYSPIPGYTNLRALVYTYEIDTSNSTEYDDYVMTDTEAVLNDRLRVFRGRMIFSRTENIALPQNV